MSFLVLFAADGEKTREEWHAKGVGKCAVAALLFFRKSRFFLTPRLVFSEFCEVVRGLHCCNEHALDMKC